MSKILFWKTLVCGECKVSFQITEPHFDHLKNTGATFYCPNGHGRYFTDKEQETDKLRRERDRLKQRAAYLERGKEAAEARAQKEKHRAAAFKGHWSRTKKRILHGVCPCCNRQFENLQKHMASKHPEYAGELEESTQ